jgi:DNA invertase Pin-like site-specific DNA recombinase
MPFANKLNSSHSRRVAEHERAAINARTKAALAAAKARGVKLGGPKLPLAQLNGATTNKAEADRFILCRLSDKHRETVHRRYALLRIF